MRPLKTYMPKSLFGRAVVIIILPIVIMQVLVAYIFFNAHWAAVTANLSDSVAADIAVTTELYNQVPSRERAEQLDRMIRPKMQLSVAFEANDKLPTNTRSAFFSVLDKTLQRALSRTLSDSFWFDTTRYPNHIDIRVAVKDGVLRYIAPRERVFAPTGFVFIFWLVTATVLLTLISILFIRNQARPIAKLAAAADAFGKGQDIGDFKPTGASEVRLAGQSFLKMRGRIRRQIEQRTFFLAGVSHDLRTPLTRLNLHLAMQDDTPENKAARRDIKDMGNMLDGYLDFARDMTGEDSVETDIGNFLRAVADKETPSPELIISEEVCAPVKPQALKRAIRNLISNANKYGGACRISLDRAGNVVSIIVEDNGPGIHEEQRGEAVKPFQRLDTARNQNIEGTGLGLTITKDIARSHGGKLILGESELGGLKAEIRLPI